MAVSWNDLLLAFKFASVSSIGENQAFLCKRTGNLYYHSDLLDEEHDLPDDIEDDEKYIQIPDGKELDLGKPLVLEFARQFLPYDFNEVRRLFSRKGAYVGFKKLLIRRRALDRWYDFESNAKEKALRAWCDLHSIDVVD